MMFIVPSQGVCLSGVTNDGKGQQYRTPDHVISSCGSDIIIVGRGIYEVIQQSCDFITCTIQEPDPVASAIQYRTEGYEAYLQRVKQL